MSHYVTPFLVLNLGAEMVYVIAQRLQAQNIPVDKTNIVLDEIVSVLVSKQLITELMKPQQAAYSHEAVRDIIEDVTQSSMMRLDDTSMGKLWDLITMVFKWQVTMADEVIQLTLRHLYEIETYAANSETQLQLNKVQNLIDNFNKILSVGEKDELRHDVLSWLKNSNVRVSLLLRMGLQKMDASFITEDLNPVAEQMLKNLGENIYSVTKNGRILEQLPLNNNNGDGNGDEEHEVNELQLFVEQILGGAGDRKLSSSSSENVLRLTIDNNNENCSSTNSSADNDKNIFDSISVEKQSREMEEIVNDMELITGKDDNLNLLTDDLLEMIGGGEVNEEV